MVPSDSQDSTRALAELSAVARHSTFFRRYRTWRLESTPQKILIGSEPGCDWVLEGPNVQPRECVLRWDGQLLMVRGLSKTDRHEVILEPNAPLMVGALELVLTPLLEQAAAGEPPLDEERTLNRKGAATPPPVPADDDDARTLYRKAEPPPLPAVVVEVDEHDVTRYRKPEPTAKAAPPPPDSDRTRFGKSQPAAPAKRPLPDERTLLLGPRGQTQPGDKQRADRRSMLPPAPTKVRGRSTSGEIAAPRPRAETSQTNVLEATEPKVVIDPALAIATRIVRDRGGALLRALVLLPLLVFASGREPADDTPLAAMTTAPPAVLVASAAPVAVPPPRPVEAPAARPTVTVTPPTVTSKTVSVTAAAVVAAPVAAAPAAIVIPPPPAVDPVAAARRKAADDAAFARIGADCRQLPYGTHASAEEHAMLQMAIEAYQHGRRSDAQRLFQSLVCRPDVGEPARFMARLLVASAPPPNALPRERGARIRRLLDETEREIEEHPELWGQRESLAGADLANPTLSPLDFRDQPKCNIFIGEMLFRSGFIPPGTPVPGQARAAYPSVNQMVARAQRLARGERWDVGDGAQWFDLVQRDAAEPGDLVLIAARDRGDGLATEHGHVEIIRDIVYDHGNVKSVSTVGARSRGALSTPSGRIFGSQQGGAYQFSEFAMLVRPRMR